MACRASTIFIFLSILIGLSCARHKGTRSPCTENWSGTLQLGVASGLVYTNGSALDSQCNLYLGGYTDSSFHGNSVAGIADSFLIKYDISGTRQWTRFLGSSEQVTYANAIAVDSEKDAYIAGFTTGSLDGEALTGTQDLFLTKYNSLGIKQWTRLLGAAGVFVYAYALALDSQDNLFITGQVDGDFEGNALLGTSDAFLTKFTKDGTKVWTKRLGASGTYTYASAITTGTDDTILVAGYTDGGLNGNSVTGALDAFLASYQSDGTLQWVRQLGSAGVNTVAATIASDSQGDHYLAGWTLGALDGNTLIGVADFFVTKYQKNGTKLWTKTAGNPGSSVLVYYNSSAIDASDNIYVSGSIDGGLDGGTLYGNRDAFLIKYGATGTKLWTRQIGASSANVYPMSVSVTGEGTAFVSGYTEGPLPGQALTGLTDTFVAAFSSLGILK